MTNIKERLEGVTLDGQPVYHYIKEEDDRQSAALHRKEVMSTSVGVGYSPPTSKFGNISGVRSQYSNQISALSPEVLAHCNYLYEMGGDKAVSDHLNMPKQEVQNGAIEAALREVEEKVKFYTLQAERAQQEVAKFTSVRDNLNAALAVMLGKVVVPASSQVSSQSKATRGPNILPRGFWSKTMKEVLGDREIPRKQFVAELRAVVPQQPNLAMQAIYRAVATGEVIVTPSNTVKLAKSA